MKRFPDGFLWGVATSAYQVEGSVDVDGKGPSIWDAFVGESGDTGEIACDHYRLWREDVALLAELGVNAYRFSISWPRLFPTGRRPVERRGRDHYDRLIDALLEKGITPIVTLYHWDLPLALEHRGGWLERDTVERFADYAATCFDAYGDRVRWWCTVNEPWIIGLLGYLHGLHAPGIKGDVLGEGTAFHHALLAHGRAVEVFRDSGREGRIGAALCLAPHYAATDDPADVEAAQLSDAYVNRWFLDPIFKGSYPSDLRALWEERLGPLEFVRDGDLATIATRSDFLGVNYYSRRVVRAAPDARPWPWAVVVPGDAPTTEGGTQGVPMTDAGTEIVPEALTELLERIHDDYGDVPIVITENGAVFPEPVHDERRVRFLHEHLAAVHAAIELGVSVVGYCHWSFMDNLEWALGYAQRFGLVHVDYETQARTIKHSGRYYAEVARANALVAPKVPA
ncbi:MAG TPA: GH1 family beta-glucosidase [Gaiellaceae bacterium]|nr:GH1 family beta-glucosidase [Gaiellaceae bacterium]